MTLYGNEVIQKVANIEDYLQWRGDLSFQQDAFNAVDNLILSELAYVDLKDIVPTIENGGSITLRQAAEDFFELNDEEDLRKVQSFIWEAPFFMQKMAQYPRFAQIELCNYEDRIDNDEQMQFAAFHAKLSDGTTYIAFRGTDDTLVGWKEDFNMSFIQPVPSQIAAVEYVKKTVKAGSGKLRLGGHSKGGNLAIYAAVKSAARIRRRIIEVYNNDGPGFDHDMLAEQAYQDMLPKVKTIVPEHSVVGMLLEHEERYMVVKSTQTGIMQHDALSWQVTGKRFDTVKEVSRSSRLLNEALSSWINGLTPKQRAAFVETLFSIITASGAKTLSDIRAERFSSANAAIKVYTALDRDTKAMLRRILRSLSGEFGRVRRNKNP